MNENEIMIEVDEETEATENPTEGEEEQPKKKKNWLKNLFAGLGVAAAAAGITALCMRNNGSDDDGENNSLLGLTVDEDDVIDVDVEMTEF